MTVAFGSCTPTALSYDEIGARTRRLRRTASPHRRRWSRRRSANPRCDCWKARPPAQILHGHDRARDRVVLDEPRERRRNVEADVSAVDRVVARSCPVRRRRLTTDCDGVVAQHNAGGAVERHVAADICSRPTSRPEVEVIVTLPGISRLRSVTPRRAVDGDRHARRQRNAVEAVKMVTPAAEAPSVSEVSLVVGCREDESARMHLPAGQQRGDRGLCVGDEYLVDRRLARADLQADAVGRVDQRARAGRSGRAPAAAFWRGSKARRFRFPTCRSALPREGRCRSR